VIGRFVFPNDIPLYAGDVKLGSHMCLFRYYKTQLNLVYD
jgi:hypothetical protein